MFPSCRFDQEVVVKKIQCQELSAHISFGAEEQNGEPVIDITEDDKLFVRGI